MLRTIQLLQSPLMQLLEIMEERGQLVQLLGPEVVELECQLLDVEGVELECQMMGFEVVMLECQLLGIEGLELECHLERLVILG